MESTDLTQRALDALRPPTAKTTKATDQDEARRIRASLLGALMRQRRLAAARALSECATFMGAAPDLIEAWEFGESSPSLPQLELLAAFLEDRAAGSESRDFTAGQSARDEYIFLRRRLIGALLRAARLASGLSLSQVAESASLTADQLERFEFGEETLPLSDLVALVHALGTDLSAFAAPLDHLPGQSRSSESTDAADRLKSDWRHFADDGENLPFIRLAMAFQHIARDDLHRIADALLAIIGANGDAKGWSGSPS